MKKVILSLALAALMLFGSTASFAETAAAADKYTDISGHWAREAINAVADESVFGPAGSEFEPNKPVTRSEFVRMLHKALGIQIAYFKATDITEYFNDVKNDDPLASPLYDLVTANIVDWKGSFVPEGPLSREDMVHLIINSLEYKTSGNYVMIQIYPMPFNDDKDINALYKNDFIKAQVLRLVNGTGNGMFLPKNSATRAEAAAMAFRLQQLLKTLVPVEKVQVVPSAEMTGDGILMEMTITNDTGKKVTINHTSGQKYDFKLLDADRNILYTWSADKMFTMALGSTVLEPGESIVFKDTIPLGDSLDKAVTMTAYIVGASEDFAIDPEGYEAVIKR